MLIRIILITLGIIFLFVGIELSMNGISIIQHIYATLSYVLSAIVFSTIIIHETVSKLTETIKTKGN